MQYQTATPIGTIATEQNKVLRNTYMMLSLTMIPTVIGAFIGMSMNFSFMAASPIMSSLLMFGAMIGMLFAVSALRNSVWGIAALLGFTFVAGVFLGPILQVAQQQLAFFPAPLLAIAVLHQNLDQAAHLGKLVIDI